MKLATINKGLLSLIAVLGFGFLAYPQQASAEVIRSGRLSTSDNFCPHRNGCREDTYLVNLVGGQTYVIDLTSSSFDTYLFLETSGGTLLRSNDDGGVGLNSRIIFTPSSTGNYRVVVSSFGAGATGSYNMRVSP